MALSRSARGLELYSILQNRVQETSADGTTITAGNPIVPNVSFTAVKTGKVRVSAWLTSNAPGSSGTYRPTLSVHQGMTTVTAAAMGALTTGGACVFEFDGLAVGTVATFAFGTTAGDASVTLGTGSLGFGAGMLVEELP